MGFAYSFLIQLIPQLVVLAGCIIYISRVNGAESILFLLGKILSIIAIILNFALNMALVKQDWPTAKYATMMIIPTGIGFIGMLTFAIGFIMMAVKQKKVNPVE